MIEPSSPVTAPIDSGPAAATDVAPGPVRAEPADYDAAVESCALVDFSERGKLALTGSEAKDFLQGQVTNDVLALEPGHGCYAAFLTHKGKMLGDLRVLDAGDELLLDCERVVLQPLFTLIQRFKLGRQVELHKRTLQRGLLSLVGPRARAIAGADGLGEVEHDNVEGEIDGVSVRLIATHLGVDVLCPTEETARVTDALVAAGARRAPGAVAEVLRVERGRPRYGHELDDTVIPQEAALNDRAVSFTKGCYVGQETVARLFYRGKPNRHLRGLRLDGDARTSEELFCDGRAVGRLGTVAASPAHGVIALGIVRREVSPGDTVSVGDGSVSAVVSELPF